MSLYRNGPFTDLCLGPHGPSTGRIGAFKLNSLAGAYWRGDETRQMLTRIYGTAFFSARPTSTPISSASSRRGRAITAGSGPQLGLFDLRPEAPGMPFWLPNGAVLWRLVEAEVRAQLTKRGYEEIKTPRVLDEELWHRSGHWDNYRENMFFAEPSERERDERRFALKPMNCPGACLVFASQRHSYRDLPLRLAEFGDVSRYEREGVLHGLLRVRAFTQDDAHVYCTLEQVPDEVDSICEAIDELYCALRLRPGAGRALDPAAEVDRLRRAVGARRGRRCARRSSVRAATTTSARGRGPSTGRRSTSTSPTRSGARGSAAPARSTSSCPSASSSATRARTTPSTGR